MTRQDAPQDAPTEAIDLSILAPPLDPRENLEWRKTVWKSAKKSPDIQSSIRRRCAADPLFFFAGFLWTFDPRDADSADRVKPFCLWPSQVGFLHEVVAAIDGPHDLLADKSRDEGMTWISLGEMIRRLLFESHCPMLVASRVEDLVDKAGDPDSLFAKVDFMLQHLPSWLRPLRMDRTYLHLGNLDNGSGIDGRATTGDLSAGGRRRVIFLDEFARVPNDEEVCAATKDTSPCRLFISTPKVTGMAFKRMRFEGKVHVATLHWSGNPRKSVGLYQWRGDHFEWPTGGSPEAARAEAQRLRPDKVVPADYPQTPIPGTDSKSGKVRSPWYDWEDSERSRLEVAENLDVDYATSGEMFFDSAVLGQIRSRDCLPPVYEADVVGEAVVKDAGRGRLKVWAEPHGESNYVMGADIGLGTGASNSAITILDVAGGVKSAEYVAADVSPEALARVAVVLAKWAGGQLGQAFQAWEANGPGLIYGKELLRLGCRYIYWRRQEAADRPLGTGAGKTQVPCWHSSREAKEILLGDFRGALQRGDFVQRSLAAVQEAESYIYFDTGEIGPAAMAEERGGARAAHGDRVIADAVAFLGLREQPKACPPEKRAPLYSVAWVQEQEEARGQ